MSKEHIWPDWLNNVSTEIGGRPTHSKMFVNPTGRTVVLEDDDTSDVTKKKNRKVCATCNNGWMSAIEDSIKPVLSPLVQGEKCEIEVDLAMKLSCWLAMRAVCFDSRFPKSSIVDGADRRFIFQNKVCPPNWQVFIGQCEPSSPTFDHYAARLTTFSEKDVVGKPVNAFALAMRFGRFVGFTIVHYVPRFDFEPKPGTSKCDLINPLVRFKPFKLARRGVLSPNEVYSFVTAFHDRIDQRSNGVYKDLHGLNGNQP